MKIRLSVAACLAIVVAACSGTGTPGTAGTGGLDGSTSEGPSDPSSPDGGSSSNPDPGTTPDAGAPIYCGGDSKSCICGHSAEYGTAGASCSSSSVAATGLCCAAPGWPGSATCVCTQMACDQYSSDTCTCGAAGTLQHPVGSCSQPTGGVCCMDTGAFGTHLCSCHKDLKQCPPDEQTVTSCTVAAVMAIGCDGKVSACQ